MNRTRSVLLAVGMMTVFLTWQGCKKDKVDPALATVTTSSVTGITDVFATAGGEVTSDGGSAVTARGVCWSTSPGPTISDDKNIVGAGIGSFGSSITGLTPNTTYFLRAYATNAVGTAFGNEVSFTTGELPTIATNTANVITHNSATVSGNITVEGGSPVTDRGICYATTTGPTIASNKTTNGTGIGSFEGALTGLTPSTQYFARAYATNDAGTAYGNEISFTTAANSSVTLDVFKDASIFNNAAGNAVNGDYGSGGSQVLQVGFSSSSSMYARALIQFDVSSIPGNAVIESVSLQMTDAVSGGSVPAISVYRVTQAWTEGSTADACVTTAGCSILGSAIDLGGDDVTWNVTDFSTGTAWTTAGGLFNASASAVSTDPGANLNLFTSATLTSDVQAWVNSSLSNYGWILKIAEPGTTGSGKIKRYGSQESANGAVPMPKLTIIYH